MPVDPSKFGPFAPMVGYSGAVMASGGALFVLWAGRMKTWRPPSEALPGAAGNLVLLLCGIFMVVEYYFAEPSHVKSLVAATGLTALCAVIFFLRYSSLISTWGYTKPLPDRHGGVQETVVLGGRFLRPDVQQKLRDGVDEQALLEGAAYNVNLLWDRANLQWVRTRVLFFFISTMVLGTSALTLAGFTTQVILTNRSASSVIHANEAPGLSKQ